MGITVMHHPLRIGSRRATATSRKQNWQHRQLLRSDQGHGRLQFPAERDSRISGALWHTLVATTAMEPLRTPASTFSRSQHGQHLPNCNGNARASPDAGANAACGQYRRTGRRLQEHEQFTIWHHHRCQ